MINVLRVTFVIISAIIGWHIGELFSSSAKYYGSAVGLVVAFLFMGLEIFFARRYIGTISIVILGLIFGFIVSYIFTSALLYLPWVQSLVRKTPRLEEWVSFSITFLFSFLAIIAILRSKDDFKFVIPFIELAREKKGGSPIILDTSVIIDGRIVGIFETKLVDVPIILPRFVLEELHNVADSFDKLKRARGRYGLDILNRLQQNKELNIQITEAEFPEIMGADNKLIELAKRLKARIMTTDYNLNKVAQLHGIEVININELANAFRPVYLPGESMELKIIRPGEEPYQGVGYLNDGTMVVVEGAANKIGQRVTVVVTGTLQTSAGKMIFASLTQPERPSPYR